MILSFNELAVLLKKLSSVSCNHIKQFAHREVLPSSSFHRHLYNVTTHRDTHIYTQFKMKLTLLNHVYSTYWHELAKRTVWALHDRLAIVSQCNDKSMNNSHITVKSYHKHWNWILWLAYFIKNINLIFLKNLSYKIYFHFTSVQNHVVCHA